MELDNGNRNDTDRHNVTPEETITTTMSDKKPSIEQPDETPNENKNVWYTIKEPFNEEKAKVFERSV